MGGAKGYAMSSMLETVHTTPVNFVTAAAFVGAPTPKSIAMPKELLCKPSIHITSRQAGVPHIDPSPN